jgi:hypothetical protein
VRGRGRIREGRGEWQREYKIPINGVFTYYNITNCGLPPMLPRGPVFPPLRPLFVEFDPLLDPGWDRVSNPCEALNVVPLLTN